MIIRFAIFAAALAGGIVGFELAVANAAPLDQYVTSNWLGVCVKEEGLDDPEIWGKGGTVPPTCIPEDAPRSISTLAEALGRWPDLDEYATYTYRWFKVHDPDRVLYLPIPEPESPTITPPAPPPVPLGGAGLYLSSAMACVLGRRLFRNR